MPADLYLYDEITDEFFASMGFGISPLMLLEGLNEHRGDEVTLHINSPGGFAYEGLAMKDIVANHGNVKAVVEGQAASAATLVMLGAKEVKATESSVIMIHEGRGSIFGATEKEMLMFSDGMSKLNNSAANLYSKKTGGAKSKDEFLKIMDPGKYLSAEEATEMKLIDGISSAEPGEISLKLSAFTTEGIKTKNPEGVVRVGQQIAANGTGVGSNGVFGRLYCIQRTREENMSRLRGQITLKNQNPPPPQKNSDQNGQNGPDSLDSMRKQMQDLFGQS